MESAAVITLFGYTINMVSVLIFSILVGLLILFVRIQFTDKLDFADMITKDGRTVSLTKVLQLIGGLTATWVIIKTTMSTSLSVEIFAVYLTYVASIEGFSKFVSARYQYTEKSVRDARPPEETSLAGTPVMGTEIKEQKVGE